MTKQADLELSTFQLSVLEKFNGVRALTETGLARVLKSEKAVARHAITTLKNAGLLKSIGAYEFALTPEGQLRIGGKAEPDPKAKREAEKIPSGKTTFKVIKGEPTEIPIEEEPEYVDPYDMAPAKKDAPAPELPAPAGFDKLVADGLKRLNEQLGFKAVAIENQQLKINTLQSLARGIDPIDHNVANLLRQIAADIVRVGAAK